MTGTWCAVSPYLSYQDGLKIWESIAQMQMVHGVPVKVYRCRPPFWYYRWHKEEAEFLRYAEVVWIGARWAPPLYVDNLDAWRLLPSTPRWLTPADRTAYDRYRGFVALNDPNSPVRRYMAAMNRQASKGGKWATGMKFHLARGYGQGVGAVTGQTPTQVCDEWEPVPYSPPVKF